MDEVKKELFDDMIIVIQKLYQIKMLEIGILKKVGIIEKIL